MVCENKFWLNDINQLFCNLSPLPSGNEAWTTPENLNRLTRLVIYITIILLLLLAPVLPAIVLVVGIIAIIVVNWVVNMGATTSPSGGSGFEIRATYTPTELAPKCTFLTIEKPAAYNPCDDIFAKPPPEPYTNSYWVNANSSLLGGRNERINIPPIIPNRLYDWSYNADSNLVVPPGINDLKYIDDGSSGMFFDPPCDQEELPCMRCPISHPCTCPRYAVGPDGQPIGIDAAYSTYTPQITRNSYGHKRYSDYVPTIQTSRSNIDNLTYMSGGRVSSLNAIKAMDANQRTQAALDLRSNFKNQIGSLQFRRDAALAFSGR